MKVGLYFDLRNPSAWPQNSSRLYGFTLEMCEEIERLGGAAVWTTEHHLFEDGYLTQPLTFLAAAAARTKQIRLGTGILIAPLRSAVQIAEEATVVDIISNGRLDLGLGAGYRIPEYELFGADISRRYETLDQRVGELRRIWKEGKVTPAPVQNPVPIWMGYQGPKGARRAGLMGENLLSLDPALLEPYRAGLVEGGHDPLLARTGGAFQGWITADPDGDWPLVSKHLAHQLNSYRRHMFDGTGQPAPKPVDTNKLRGRALGSGGPLGSFLYATPQDAAAQIKAYVAGSPVEIIFLWASIGGMPEAVVARHVHTVCTQLAPLLA